MNYKIGDKVRVLVEVYQNERSFYKFMPDLAGKVGEVVELICLGDEPVYLVKFEPFQVGVLTAETAPHDEPKEWRTETNFAFCNDDLEANECKKLKEEFE